MLIFVPTYNERDNVPGLLEQLLAQRLDADLLFVDDASPDGTGELLDGLAAAHPRVTVVHRAGKLGIGSAHQLAIAWAYDRGYRTLVTMDADFTHSPADIPRLLAAGRGHAMAMGSRFMDAASVADWSLPRRLLTFAGHFLTLNLLDMPYDATGAFRVYDLTRLPRGIFGSVTSSGYAFFFESVYVLHRHGYALAEMPILLPKRVAGHSKMSWLEAVHSLRRLAVLALRAPATENLAAASAGQGRWAWRLGIAMTAGLVALHALVRADAGGLWRDEANSAAIAALPTWTAVWSLLPFDSFPAGWFVLLKSWEALFGASDGSLRTLALAMGLSVLALLWWLARLFQIRVPLWGLALLGASVSAISYGDSVRAYGAGMAAVLLTYGLVYRLVERVTPARVMLALAAAIVSVQLLYYGAVCLLAAGMAGMLVSLRRRRFANGFTIGAVGLACAASYLPYLGTFRSMATWNAAVKYDIDLAWIGHKLAEATAPNGSWALTAWIAAALAACLAAALAQRAALFPEVPARERDASLYAGLTIGIGTVTYLLFLLALRYYMQPWYFLALFALVGAALDGAIQPFAASALGARVRLAAAGLVIVASVLPLVGGVQPRKTNLDELAARLTREATPGDLVIVNPWTFGISFNRYYRGQAPWTTLPPLADHRVHRFDLFRARMLDNDACLPVLDAARRALVGGHHVYLVGDYAPVPGAWPVVSHVGPHQPGETWHDGPPSGRWSAQVSTYLALVAGPPRAEAPELASAVSPYEDARLNVFTGWGGDPRESSIARGTLERRTPESPWSTVLTDVNK